MYRDNNIEDGIQDGRNNISWKINFYFILS